MGHRGVYFKNRNEEYFVEAVKVNPVDTTAAGDAFVGAFAFGLIQELGHYDCLRLANASAALSVTRMGAQPSLPSLKEVKEFLTEKKINMGNLI
jgi:ribokinase